MRIAILSANLNNFDTGVSPVKQNMPDGVDEIAYHCFTDNDFPPVTGLTPRFQYRIPKLFGFEMFPNYDIYLWIDSSMSLQDSNSVKWFLEQLEDTDAAFFIHPWRKTIKEEVDHIEDHLQREKPYITSRYKNGLHKEMLKLIQDDEDYADNFLLTSTAFIYRNCEEAQNLLMFWWYYQSRYFTCDQVVLPYAVIRSEATINIIQENQFKIPYLSLISHHK